VNLVDEVVVVAGEPIERIIGPGSPQMSIRDADRVHPDLLLNIIKYFRVLYTKQKKEGV